ncbi:DUF424 domain-containing protein [Archaeoglobus profundus]|uniref:DUF424 domain-containing protein n=1 Tax=Archaeoglobus profundus (strain DSM 5631 / JCM 9629 / NBRC 100127 / Av18) TaxID=572546 RepID=D2RGI6_ARCPA|nr:DUF424 domain-containing protein [Archaeoglobus profundus]ADB57411.1 Protein of unknown function DUF424 [Archaeoglobus profundus DSM 5631]
MKFRLKVYRVKGEIVVAVCDSEIVGKTFREGDLKIEVKESFYGEKDVDEDEVRRALRIATIANITGRRAVQLAIEMGIIDKENVLKIEDCWHAQMVVI